MIGSELLSRQDTALAPACGDDVLTRDRPASQDSEASVVLDMGEASREQGFRLNGCR